MNNKIKIEIDKDAYVRFVQEQFKDTDFQVKCPNCQKSVGARFGENICNFCGNRFTLEPRI